MGVVCTKMKGYIEKLYHFVLDPKEIEKFKVLLREPFLENQYRKLKDKFLELIKSMEEENEGKI